MAKKQAENKVKITALYCRLSQDDGRDGESNSISNQDEQIICPTEHYYRKGIKASNPRPQNPCRWDQVTVRHILENRQYTGCTVNFKSTFVSFKVKKKVHIPEEDWQIIPNTQEAIIDEDTFERVQELRKHPAEIRRREKQVCFQGFFTVPTVALSYITALQKALKTDKSFTDVHSTKKAEAPAPSILSVTPC